MNQVGVAVVWGFAPVYRRRVRRKSLSCRVPRVGAEQPRKTLEIPSSAELPTQKPTQSEHRGDSLSQRLANAVDAIEALELPADAHGAILEILRMAFPASRNGFGLEYSRR